MDSKNIFHNINLKPLKNEIFKDVKDYEGFYQISNLGRVKSLKRVIPNINGVKRTYGNIIVKQNLDNYGYPQILLSKNGIKKTAKIHQLVAIAFLKHKPCGLKMVVDHINNIKIDNKVENLQIITTRKNITKDKTRGASKYTGVTRCLRTNKWISRIEVNGKMIRLGLFKNEDEAGEYYENALKAIEEGKEIKRKVKIRKSKYKGVYWVKRINKWTSQVWFNKKCKSLGYYDLEIEAANAIIKFKNEQVGIV